jgi:hypothetical protein
MEEKGNRSGKEENHPGILTVGREKGCSNVAGCLSADSDG